jgi:RNA polymerase sigma factor (sigma-70 family)
LIANDIDIQLIVSKIRSGKTGRDEVLVSLYHDKVLRNKIEHVAAKYGGQKMDLDLIFNSTLMQFVKTVINNKDFSIQSTLYSYISGITRFLMLNELKKSNKTRTEAIDDQIDIKADHTPESLIIDQSKVDQLHGLLQKLGKNCKEVLMHWANGYSMKEIAKMMDYKSDMMAKKKKYKCFKELLNYLEEHPEIKNVLR